MTRPAQQLQRESPRHGNRALGRESDSTISVHDNKSKHANIQTRLGPELNVRRNSVAHTNVVEIPCLEAGTSRMQLLQRGHSSKTGG